MILYAMYTAVQFVPPLCSQRFVAVRTRQNGILTVALLEISGIASGQLHSTVGDFELYLRKQLLGMGGGGWGYFEDMKVDERSGFTATRM